MNLAVGNYLFEVQDVRNCSSQLPVSILNTNDIVFEVDNITGVTCFGDPNGNAELSILQIQSPYTITWDNDATTNAVSNLSSGEHVVSLEDSNSWWLC